MNGNRGVYRRRNDKSRGILIGAIAVVLVAIAVVTFFIFAELFSWFEKNDSDPVGDMASDKFTSTTIEVSSSDVHTGDLILVNDTYKYVFSDSDINLVSILDATLRKKHSYINSNGENKEAFSYYPQNNNCAKMEIEALKALIAWTDDFSITNNNIDLFIFNEDGYRTEAEQSALYAKDPARYTIAGATEHHTGKVIDLYGQVSQNTPIYNIDDPEYKDIYQWLYDNAYKYGFIHRYPASKSTVTGVTNESYHFRQVGYAHAYYMQKNNLCLEEYLELLKTSTSPLEFNGDDGNRYMVYYQAASEGDKTTLTVPADLDYTVSGDNMGGFIVTVTLGK